MKTVIMPTTIKIVRKRCIDIIFVLLILCKKIFKNFRISKSSYIGEFRFSRHFFLFMNYDSSVNGTRQTSLLSYAFICADLIITPFFPFAGGLRLCMHSLYGSQNVLLWFLQTKKAGHALVHTGNPFFWRLRKERLPTQRNVWEKGLCIFRCLQQFYHRLCGGFGRGDTTSMYSSCLILTRRQFQRSTQKKFIFHRDR